MRNGPARETLKNSARLLLLAFFFAVTCGAADRTFTRIVLDTTTFPRISRPLLQETADQVAKVVDELIPGKYPRNASPVILCFVANGTWRDMPRAIVDKPWKIEPASANKYGMRIALTPEVLPGAWQRLIFQLSHELAHQKMDARVDNNAMEAFATAVSLETLHRLGYDSYREANERYYTQLVPSEVMSALNHSEWNKVALYLRYKWRAENIDKWDRATHFVAAIALRKMNGFPWERLLNIGVTAECGSRRLLGRARYCPLSPDSLEGFPESVKILLARSEMSSVIARTSVERPEGEGLIFKEKGKWISLRWVRKHDPLVPDGFVPID